MVTNIVALFLNIYYFDLPLDLKISFLERSEFVWLSEKIGEVILSDICAESNLSTCENLFQ